MRSASRRHEGRRRPARRLAVLTGLVLVVAACNGDPGPDPTGATTTSAAPETVTTTAPPATEGTPAPTTAAPTTPPTTVTTTTPPPPDLEPQALLPDLGPGTVTSYDGRLEGVLAWDGALASATLGGEGQTGSRTTSMEGRRRVLTLAEGGGYEIVEEFTPIRGRLTEGRDGDSDGTDLDRSELPGLVPDFGSLAVGGDLANLPSGETGLPGKYAPRTDPLLTAAVVGPPLPPGPVDAGAVWESEASSIFGAVQFESTVIGEEPLASGRVGFVIEFEGTIGPARSFADAGDALDLMAPLLAPGELEGMLPPGFDGSAAVSTAEVSGVARFEPELGMFESLSTSVTYVIDFSGVVDEVEERFSLEARLDRVFDLEGRTAASAFDRDSILGRFAVSADEAAEFPLGALDEFSLADPDPRDSDTIVSALSSIRADLVAGVAIRSAADGEGNETVVASIVTGGEFRGAPFVAEELGAFLSATRPSRVRLAGGSAYRVSIDGREWLFYGDQAHLFIMLGDRDVSSAAMSELIRAADPYLWQEGDCLDFTDGFDSATPYAPFGLSGLGHCGASHYYEVIHSETLPEGPDARFPRDLAERSRLACADAFVGFAGTTELRTAFALIRYLPDEEEWAHGSRYLACMVSVGSPEGLQRITGRLNGTDPGYAVELDVGSCLSGSYPVDCSAPHDREIIAAFDAPGEAGADMPSVRSLEDQIDADCSAAFGELALGTGPGVVEVFDLTDIFTFWEAGARRYYCTAVVFGDDGLPLEVTGTFAGGWEEASDRVVA